MQTGITFEGVTVVLGILGAVVYLFAATLDLWGADL